MISVDLGDVHPRELRDLDQFFFAGPTGDLARASMSLAKFKFRVDMDGRLILLFWVLPEPYPGLRRGWVQMVFGRAIDDVPAVRWARQAVRFYRAVMMAKPYDVLRAWVAADDPRAERFATHLGFRYDAGPAADILPDGRDANLMIWRAK